MTMKTSCLNAKLTPPQKNNTMFSLPAAEIIQVALMLAITTGSVSVIIYLTPRIKKLLEERRKKTPEMP